MWLLLTLTVARVRLLGPWSCRVRIGLLVWPPGGGASVAEECARSRHLLRPTCGKTEEVAGNWWAGFVAGNGRVRLEELTAHWECVSGFSSHTPSSCTN